MSSIRKLICWRGQVVAFQPNGSCEGDKSNFKYSQWTSNFPQCAKCFALFFLHESKSVNCHQEYRCAKCPDLFSSWKTSPVLCEMLGIIYYNYPFFVTACVVLTEYKLFTAMTSVIKSFTQLNCFPLSFFFLAFSLPCSCWYWLSPAVIISCL